MIAKAGSKNDRKELVLSNTPLKARGCYEKTQSKERKNEIKEWSISYRYA